MGQSTRVRCYSKGSFIIHGSPLQLYTQVSSILAYCSQGQRLSTYFSQSEVAEQLHHNVMHWLKLKHTNLKPLHCNSGSILMISCNTPAQTEIALPYMAVSTRQVGDGRVTCTRGKRFYFTLDRHLAATRYLFQNRI